MVSLKYAPLRLNTGGNAFHRHELGAFRNKGGDANKGTVINKEVFQGRLIFDQRERRGI